MLRSLACLALLAAAPVFAQPELAGDWSGELDVSALMPGAPALTVIFHLTPEADGLAATFDSPDQGAFAIPVDEVAYDAEARTLTLTGQQVVYTGTLDAEGARIDGTWAQGGRELPLVLTPYEAPAAPAASETKERPKQRGDLSGDWLGVLPLPNGGEMRLTFHLARTDDGGYTAVLNAPGQAENLDLGEITVQGQAITIDVMGQASFTGTIADDEATAEGTWAQGDQKLPMTLTRQ